MLCAEWGVIDIGARARFINPIPNESKENHKIRRQLSMAFTQDVPVGKEHRYKQSIAINELLFDGAELIPAKNPNGPKSGRVAGTAYPTVQLRGAADNCVLWPEFVDSALQIKSVRYVLVEAADTEKSAYTLNTLAIAESFSGRDIIWQDNPLPEDQRRTYFALENNRWVQRDSFGRILDIH